MSDQISFQAFMDIIARKVIQAIVETLKDAKSKGKTLDDVIRSYEEKLEESESAK